MEGDVMSEQDERGLRDRLHAVWMSYVLPAGVFCMLVGMIVSSAHSVYPRLFQFAIAFPALVLIFLRPAALRDLLQSRIVVVFLAFAAYALLSLAWGRPADGIDSYLKRPVLVLLLFLAIIELTKYRSDRRELALKMAIVVSAIVAVISATYFVAYGEGGRFSGYGALSNSLMVSHVFGFFAAAGLGLLLTERSGFQWLAGGAAVACSTLLVLTGSRTPLLALAVTLLWLVCLRSSQRALVVVGVALLAALVVFLVWPGVFLERGLSYRPQIWAETIRQIGSHPWFGHGYGTPMRIQLPGFGEPFWESHNLTLAVIYDLGLVGGVLWTALYGTALLLCWQRREDSFVVVVSATLVYGLISGMTEGGAFLSRPKEHWFIVWIPLAFVAGELCRRRRSE